MAKRRNLTTLFPCNKLYCYRDKLRLSMKKLIFLLLVLVGITLLWDFATNNSRISNLFTAPVTNTDKINIVKEESTVITVVKKVSSSVVTIAVKKNTKTNSEESSPFYFFFGQPVEPTPGEDQAEEDYIGTGFVVNSKGIIVTNKHVVSDSSENYVVVDEKGNKYEVDKIYRDPANDIGIISIKNPAGNKLPEIVIGSSKDLQVGQFVIAIGTALGEFRNTVTTGVVSGLGRGITAGSPFQGFVERLDNVIQTDAAINPGNSGGPLLNSQGQVIGVNTAVSQQGQNIGFAIPIDIVRESIDNFNKTGQFSRPFLGVTYNIISARASTLNDLPEGALVQEVITGSSANDAGIKVGDIITKIDGNELNDTDQSLAILISKKKVGDTLSLTIFRDGEILELKAKLKEGTQ